MDHHVEIKLSKEYFLECYEESMSLKSIWVKPNYITAIVFLILSICTYYFSIGQALSVVLAMFSLFEFIRPSLSKSMWLKKQLSSKSYDKNMAIGITNENFSAKTPLSSNSMSWLGFIRIANTSRGILLWPQKGQHVYLPKSLLTQEAIDFVLSKGA